MTSFNFLSFEQKKAIVEKQLLRFDTVLLIVELEFEQYDRIDQVAIASKIYESNVLDSKAGCEKIRNILIFVNSEECVLDRRNLSKSEKVRIACSIFSQILKGDY